MKHYIIVKFNSSVSDRHALVEEIRRHFAQASEIDGINSVNLCPSVIDLPNRYDLMIILEMDKSALPVWAESSIHTEWKRRYSHLLESKAIFDCD